MLATAFIGIGFGAACGAWLRWLLGAWLNPVFPTLPLGTLAANLVGGLLMGIAVELFGSNASIPPSVRLALTTGFLGGLTTFSTFSAETVNLLLRNEYLWGGVIVAAHVIGSVAMTIAGIELVRLIAFKGAA